jgi:phospholipid/cholesterol/gamma-HCH transport system substrate-binding protein
VNERTLFRYTNEAVGAMVLLAVLIFIAAVLQSGRLRNWFEPGVALKVILPGEGLFGLSRGAKVKILGTEAGVVEEIVVDPNEQMHAVAVLKQRMIGFVRRDSEAIIRKEFGVAGAAYLEITRGKSEPLDWEYAVINAVAERAPTESMGELLSELRAKSMPILDDAKRLLVNLNAITGKIADGEGTIGRLFTEDRMAVEVETLLTEVNTNIGQFAPIMDELQTTVKNIATISNEITKQSGAIPQITRDVGKVLISLESVMNDLSRTTPELPKLIENVNAATSDVPVLLVQTQQVLSELTLLLQQLQSHWLFGGGRTDRTPTVERISPLEVTP